MQRDKIFIVLIDKATFTNYFLNLNIAMMLVENMFVFCNKKNSV